MLESKPLKSTMLVGRLGVSAPPGIRATTPKHAAVESHMALLPPARSTHRSENRAAKTMESSPLQPPPGTRPPATSEKCKMLSQRELRAAKHKESSPWKAALEGSKSCLCLEITFHHYVILCCYIISRHGIVYYLVTT